MPRLFSGIILICLLFFNITQTRAVSIPGVQTPLAINPQVNLTNYHFLYYSYRTLLNRNPDTTGVNTFLPQMESGTMSRKSFFTALFDAPEFRNNPTLTNKTEYVKRLYRTLLQREADPAGLAHHEALLKEVNEPDAIDTWFDVLNNLVGVPEYKSTNCQTGYYTYGQPLQTNSPTLEDLFAGRARFQTESESVRVPLTFNPSQVKGVYGQKMPILHNPADSKYYAITRGHGVNDKFNLYLMISNDAGASFSQVAPLFSSSVISELGDMFDGHISVDYTVCPARHIMAIECSGSFCASYSSRPFDPLSWTRPVNIISYDSLRYRSASTPAFLIDGSQWYSAWTVIDDQKPFNPAVPPDNGTESAYTRGTISPNTLSYLGDANTGQILLPSEPNTHCPSPWDCNNRDKQDWKKEGSYYYFMYNGANYYRCFRPANDTQYPNDWGIGIVRSLNPLSGYGLPGSGKIIDSPRNDFCQTAYPVLNNINGELYLYYDEMIAPGDLGSHPKRSKLIWNATIADLHTLILNYISAADTPYSPIDGKVNMLDASYLIKWIAPPAAPNPTPSPNIWTSIPITNPGFENGIIGFSFSGNPPSPNRIVYTSTQRPDAQNGNFIEMNTATQDNAPSIYQDISLTTNPNNQYRFSFKAKQNCSTGCQTTEVTASIWNAGGTFQLFGNQGMTLTNLWQSFEVTGVPVQSSNGVRIQLYLESNFTGSEQYDFDDWKLETASR